MEKYHNKGMPYLLKPTPLQCPILYQIKKIDI